MSLLNRSSNQDKNHFFWSAHPDKSSNEHPFHMVSPSPWPFLLSMSVLFMLLTTVAFMHGYSFGFLLEAGLFLVIWNLSFWLVDVVEEATFLGHHTTYVQRGLRLGFLLFLLTEVMFFFGFFWAFFHSSLAPAIQIGAVWPPRGIETFSPWGVPLLNTFILLTSGATVTWAHYALISYHRAHLEASLALLTTVILGLVFTAVQGYEYVAAPFSINDGIYGTVFFMLTGFHGFHVIIGTIMLIVSLIRTISGHFTPTRHLGFEVSAWYWHFVDVVWLFLFISIYWWGSDVI